MSKQSGDLKNQNEQTQKRNLFLTTASTLESKKMKRNFLKTISYVVLMTFVSQQLVSANPQIAETVHGFRPVATYDGENEKKSTVNVQGGFEDAFPTTAEFLNDTLALSKAGEEDIEKVVQRLEVKEQKTNENYDYVRYEFEDALEELRPEYASAVIVKNLNEENLKQLLALDFEVGIGALKGEIVLFTSGSENDIRVTAPVKAILGELSLMAHTHPRAEHTEGPSALDLAAARDKTEFVITDQAGYAYDHSTENVAQAEKLSHTRFLAELQLALSEYQKNTPNNVEARAVLNQLIAEMESMNASALKVETFRASDVEGLVVFEDEKIISVPSQDNKKARYEILDQGRELHISGNSWKAIPMSVQITADTILEFEFKNDGEIVDFTAIGFSTTNDDHTASKNQLFKLQGTENWPKYRSIHYTEDGDWQYIKVRAGDYFTGDFSYLYLANDADKKQTTDVYFKNIRIYKEAQDELKLSNKVYQAEAGLLTIEAEHPFNHLSRDEHEWQMRTDHVGTSGEGYLRAGPDIGFSQNKKYANTSAETQYKFYVSEPGIYYVWIRGLATEAGNDSLHIGLDGKETITSDRIDGFVRNEWSWSNDTLDKYPARIEIKEAGEHVLNMWMREDGLLVDKILLSSDVNFKPSGLGPQESSEYLKYTQPAKPTLEPISTLINSSSLLFTGTKDPNTSVWLNGVKVVSENNALTWSYTATNLLEGQNNFKFHLENTVGMKSQDVVLLTSVDLTPPMIEITSASLVKTAEYTLTYKVDGLEKSELKSLSEGANTFSIVSVDDAGNEAVKNFTVVLDSLAPQIEFTSATLTKNAHYTLSYKADGVQKTKDFTLIEGDNVLSVSETDEVGNMTQTSFNVVLDTVAPQITFTSPHLTEVENYTLIYTVDGAEKKKDFVLVPGDNVLSVTEKDVAENETRTSFTVIYENNPITTYEPGQFQGGTLTQDTILKAGSAPYVITENIIVPMGITLTIEAGAEIRFNRDIRMTVNNGLLLVNGTEDNRVKFTANSDAPTQRYWNAIYLNGPREGISVVNYATFEYATIGIQVNGGAPIIKNSIFENNLIGVKSNYTPFYHPTSNPHISSSYFAHNTRGIEGYGAYLNVVDSVITKNAYGLYLNGQTSTNVDFQIHDSSIYSNTNYDLMVFAGGNSEDIVNVSNNWWGTADIKEVSKKILDMNGINIGPILDGENGNPVKEAFIEGYITEDTVWTKEKGPYLVVGRVSVKEGVNLTIEPGAEILFSQSSSLNIYGVLNANGEADDRIVFRTAYEETPGSVMKRSGQLYLAGKDASQISYADFYSMEQGIVTYNASSKLSHLKIEGAREGIIVGSGSPQISDISSFNNYSTGLKIQGGAPEITQFNSLKDSVGIDILGSSKPIIKYSQIIESGQGVVVRNTANPKLFFLEIVSKGSGIVLEGNAAPEVWYSRIEGNNNNASISFNRYELLKEGLIPLFQGNSLISNRGINSFYLNDKSNGRIFNFQNNWWGTTDPSEIQKKINVSAGVPVNIDFTGFLDFEPYPAFTWNSVPEVKFSPIQNDVITFEAKTPLTSHWIFKILNDEGLVVKTIEQNEIKNFQFKWNGFDDLNQILPLGNYTWSLEAKDSEGLFELGIKTGIVELAEVIVPEVIFLSPKNTNNQKYTLIYTIDGGAQQAKVFDLTEGLNVLTLTVTDSTGKSVDILYEVHLDTVAPKVVFTSPSLENQSNYRLVYLVDGVEKTKNMTLVEGNNILNVTESDLAGNETTAIFLVELDTVAPEIVLVSSRVVNDSNYSLHYAVDGVEKTKSFVLSEGNNDLSVTEQDEAGNTTNATFIVELDTVSPVINFTSAEMTNNETYALRYTVDGIEKIKNFTLIEGENVLSVTEKDAVGNETKETFNVHLDTHFPEIIFTSSNLTKDFKYILTYVVDGISKTQSYILAEGENILSVSETDLAGNTTQASFYVALDTVVPEITVTSAGLTNETPYTLVYETDGVEKTRTYNLLEGENVLSITEEDVAGNTTTRTFAVKLDTVAPEIAFISSVWVNGSNYRLTYTADGIEKSETRALDQGQNSISMIEKDLAGNITVFFYYPYADKITFFRENQSLNDGTQLIFNHKGLEQEILPTGESITYAAGRVEKLDYPDGAAIHFSNNNNQALEIFDASGQLVEEITQPVPTPLDESLALKLSLEGGMEVYYLNAEAVEYRTAEGVRITDFILDDQKQFQSALVTYPDGTIEIIRHGFLLRRISSSGATTDYSPSGKILRENIQGSITHYYYFYDDAGKLAETRVSVSADTEITYDELGLLKSIRKGEQFIVYEKTLEIQAEKEIHVLRINQDISVGLTEDSMIRGEYWANGNPKFLSFQNGNKIFYDEQGKLLKTVDKNDQETRFEFDAQTFSKTLQVTQGNTSFGFGESGFLETITTDQGTITRLVIDKNGDGEIGGDEVSGLILETLDGSKLKDFELDADGKILSGLLETKEGVKQRIENGLMTGFETVDGKIYAVENGKATLQEWKFLDGSRVIYGGGTIQEILYPNGSRLHTIGMQNNEIETYIEDLKDGTQRIFENGKMVKLITNEGHQIYYDHHGDAEKVVMNNTSEFKIIRNLNSEGEVDSILFQDQFTYHEFSPQGQLVSLLTQGVYAEVNNDQITRLNTRFASVENPVFDSHGTLSGSFQFVDGTTQTIENGVLVQTVRPTGTIVNYENGFVSNIEIEDTHYSIIPEYETVNSEDVVFYPTNDNGRYNPLIIDNLDAKFGGSLEARQIPFQPSVTSGEDVESVVLKDEPFTMEVWLKPLSAQGRYDYNLMSQGSIGRQKEPGWAFRVINNKLEFTVMNKGVEQINTILSVDYIPSTESWDHIALIRGWDGDIDKWAITVNGKAVATSVYRKANFFNDSIFSLVNGAGKYDEARISKVARWTSDFEVPSQPYEIDPDTRLLHHFDEQNGLRFENKQKLVGVKVYEEVNGNTSVHDLTKYLLDHPESELNEILNARPLHNTLENRLGVESLLREARAWLFTLEGDAKFQSNEDALGGKALKLNGGTDQFKLSSNNLEYPSTIEFRANFEDWDQESQIISSHPDWNQNVQRFAIIKQASVLRVQVATNVFYDFPYNSTEENVWHHFAIVYNNQRQLKVFQNGQEIGFIDYAPYNFMLGEVVLVGNNPGKTKGLNGWIDELRISSKARWFENFSVPSSEYEQDEYTQMLFHFNDTELLEGKELLPENIRRGMYKEIIYSKPVNDFEHTDAIQFNGLDTQQWENVQSVNSAKEIIDIQNRNGWDVKFSDLIDMDGDGLADRISYDESTGKWWVQLNQLSQFANPVEWEGVENPEGSNEKHFKALGYTSQRWIHQNSYSELIDMNGDNLPDRLLVKPDDNGVWYIQYNTGKGFSSVEIWADNVHHASQEDVKARYALRAFSADGSELVSDLIDLDGDGLNDRVIRPKFENISDATFWFFQRNNGKGFDDTILWEGVDAQFESDQDKSAAIGYYDHFTVDYGARARTLLVDVNQDGKPDRVLKVYENYLDEHGMKQTDFVTYVQYNNGEGFSKRSRDYLGKIGLAISKMENKTIYSRDGQTYVMRDMNSDGYLDRVNHFAQDDKWDVYYGGPTYRWSQQYKTYSNTGYWDGSVDQFKVDSFTANATSINSSRYDYLHLNLKSKIDLPQNAGEIVISLGDPKKPLTYQEWRIDNLTTNWQSFYLKLNPEKPSTEKVRVEFIANGYDFNVPIYVDSVTFLSSRESAEKDWLDRMLSEENVLAEIHSERTQTLAQFLGLSEATDDFQMDWKQFLEIEKEINFDESGKLKSAQNLYGDVTQFENGKVKASVLSDGTRVEFNSSDDPNHLTQTITRLDLSTENMELQYGRVRTVTKQNQEPLQYSYDFDALGREITIVFDPAQGVTERYLGNTILSRLKSNGILTQYSYDEKGELQKTEILYKDRVRDTFLHGKTAEGHTTLTGETGIVEEYDDEGNILFHTTPDGYRYAHSFEKASKVTTQFVTETETLSDGSEIYIQIPIVTLEDDENGESIHRSRLVGYVTENGQEITYDGAEIESIRLADKTLISFDRVTRDQEVDPETGKVELTTNLEAVTVMHADGTITEFQDGLPFSVTSATGRIISLLKENNQFISTHESVAFHFEQARRFWNHEILPAWNQFQLPASFRVKTETTLDGDLITQSYAEGAVEVYEDGRISQILAEDGERLIRYDYDDEGNLTRLELEGTRRKLESTLLQIRADVAVERVKSLTYIGVREQVINHSIEGEYIVQQERLLKIRSRLESNQYEIEQISAKGGGAKGLIGDALSQIQEGMNQVNQALEQLATARVQALEQLSEQIRKASNDVEVQTSETYASIQAEQEIAERQILQQEISPVIYSWYRHILGRDASKEEYETLLARANYKTGDFGLEDLIQSLYAGDEYLARDQEVKDIKKSVSDALAEYKSLSDEAKRTFAVSLGIPLTDVVTLNETEINAILDWLLKQSIHFGQSAYIALEKILANADKEYNRLELATHLILVDLLTGTLTPAEQSDLVLSVYAMRLTAKHFGLDMHGLALTYAGLKTMFEDACPSSITPEACDFEMILHVDGNHYIVVTGFEMRETVNAAGETVLEEIVHIMDPGVGPENEVNASELTRIDFLGKWLTSTDLEDGIGYAISPRAPPAQALENETARHLSTDEQMRVRGAFFGLIAVAIIIAIVNAVAAVVSAVIVGITTLLAGLVAGLGSLAAGFGSFFTGLATLNFGVVLGGLGQIALGVGQIVGAVVSGVVAFGGQLVVGLYGAASGLVASVKGAWAGFSLVGTLKASALSSAIGYGFQGAGILLEKIGVSPKFARTITSLGRAVVGAGMLVTGNAAGLLDFTAGVSDFLNVHFEISPLANNLIDIGVATFGAFAGGGFNAGEGVTFLEASFQSGFSVLKTNLISAGLFAIGDKLGIDGNLLNLASVPLRAGLSGLVSGGSILQSIATSLSSPEFLSGALSIGSNIALDKLGAPVFAKDLVSGFISGFASGLNGGSSAGDGVNEASLSKSIFSKIGDGIKKFGSTVVTAVGNVVSFGAKVVQDIGSTTVAGVKKAVKAFSGIFNRQTQEGIYADETALKNAEITIDGDNWTWRNGNAVVQYDASTNTVTNSDALSSAKITGLSLDEGGNFTSETLSYETATQEIGGATLKQAYENGKLQEWGYYYEGEAVFEVTSTDQQGWTSLEDSLRSSEINSYQSVFIQGPESDPAPVPSRSPLSFNFLISGGYVAHASYSSNSTTTQTANSSSKFLFGNGFNNAVVAEYTSDTLVPAYVDNLSILDHLFQRIEAIIVPLYETTNLMGNMADWSTEFLKNLEDRDWVESLLSGGLEAIANLSGAIGLTYLLGKIGFNDNKNNLIQEVWGKLLASEKAQGVLDKGIAFSHSGFFAPLIAALEQKKPDQTYFDVHTIINYEGVHPGFNGGGMINNPNLKRIVNVWGTAIFVENAFLTGQNTKEVCPRSEQPCIDKSKKAVPLLEFGPPTFSFDNANFTAPSPDFENINIEIIGARHNDFSYDPAIWNVDPYEPERRVEEINKKTNLFMRNLHRAVAEDQVNPGALDTFLSDNPNVTKNHQTGVWVVDFGGQL